MIYDETKAIQVTVNSGKHKLNKGGIQQLVLFLY